MSKKRPNILLFLTDDHAPWSISAYGNRDLDTPNLNRIAREGARFANAFTPCPVCSPARACVMTGRTPSQVGIHDWLQESDAAVRDRDWLAGETTLAERLAAGGYHSMLSGKWHLGGSDRTPRGFARCFGLGGAQGVHEGEHTYHQDGAPLVLDGSKTDRITERALAMLAEAPDDRPFFLNIGYVATHSPYDEAAHDPALVAGLGDCAFVDIPPYRPHPAVKNEGLGASPDTETLRAAYRGYYAAVLELDRAVGRVLAALERSGRLENTIVVYASDHGCAMGHNGFFGKGNSTRPLNMCDVSLRVPLLAMGPGIARGKVVAEPVDHYDLFLGLCDWAGVMPRADEVAERRFPGRSLAPLARGGQPADWPGERFGEYGDLRMVRTPTHKLVRHYDCGADELYDLKADPDERRNLAEDAVHAALRSTLTRRLEAWYAGHEETAKSGLRVKELPIHNHGNEAWRDGCREAFMRGENRATPKTTV